MAAKKRKKPRRPLRRHLQRSVVRLRRRNKALSHFKQVGSEYRKKRGFGPSSFFYTVILKRKFLANIAS